MRTGAEPGRLLRVTAGYLLDNNARETVGRFGALAALFDEGTFRHFERLGVESGWSCWEVGAGGVSVATWLARRTQPNGRVLATDIDVNWMSAEGAVDFEILRHDVSSDAPPSGSFDLVHARLVLVHVREREEALRNMVSTLKPGGWLLVEDFDVLLQPRAILDTGRTDLVANRIRAGFEALLSERGVDLEFGRKLPRLLRRLGLTEVGADAYMPVALPAASALEAANVQQVRDALVSQKLATPGEIEGHLEELRRGAFDVATPPLISAWGRRA
jgi:SAM-dependent methyltransferase